MAAEHVAAAERAARTSYGKLVALLAARTGDVELAEDALATAFERALITWPDQGVPDNPDGWLLTVARNRVKDVWKSAAHRTSTPLEDDHDATGADDVEPAVVVDRRLELLFVCAHPDIDAAARTPLMLQTVLGFEAAQIAEAFNVPASAMAQRLVRAKKRVRERRIPFEVPENPQLESVLEAVYGCYSLDFERPGPMAEEAQYLAVLLASLRPKEPEAWGLASLITLSLSRANTADAYAPIEDQDPTTWDWDLVTEGERYLHRAAVLSKTPGRGTRGRDPGRPLRPPPHRRHRPRGAPDALPGPRRRRPDPRRPRRPRRGDGPVRRPRRGPRRPRSDL